jgi:acetyl esterase
MPGFAGESFALRNAADRTMTYFRTHPANQPVPLDPQLWAAIQAEPDRLYLLPLAEFRAAAAERSAATPRLNAPVKAVEDRCVGGPGSEIPLRIFRPHGRGPFPVLAYFHGGGWVVGDLDTHDDLCRALCHRAGCVVVSVDYRRAPEAKYPAALDDCWAVLRWIEKEAATIDGDLRQIAVAGDSAGGNLAAAVALRARDEKRPPPGPASAGLSGDQLRLRYGVLS